MKHWAFMTAVLVAVAGLSGCTEDQQTVSLAETDTTSAVSMIEADPWKAIDEIYQTIDIMGLESATETVLSEKFSLDMELIESFDVKYSNGRFGVSDVFILKPQPDQADQLREQLEQVKINRTKEFENYDVLGAHAIAENAQIFEQGGYVIMLMLEDNEAAREIINKYIPK